MRTTCLHFSEHTHTHFYFFFCGAMIGLGILCMWRLLCHGTLDPVLRVLAFIYLFHNYSFANTVAFTKVMLLAFGITFGSSCPIYFSISATVKLFASHVYKVYPFPLFPSALFDVCLFALTFITQDLIYAIQALYCRDTSPALRDSLSSPGCPRANNPPASRR